MFTLNNPMKVMSDHYSVTSQPCPYCKDTKTVAISSKKLFDYRNGGNVQDVLSNFDASIRERFISGVCNPCWNNFFADED